MNRAVQLMTMIAALTGAASADAQSYTVTPLGTLGGPFPGSSATGINSYGQVTGTAAGTEGGTGFAYLWTAPGPMVSLGALGALPTQSTAEAINDSSWVVGVSNSEAFLWTPQNGMQGLGFLAGGTESSAYSLNNSGTVVGGATTLGGSDSHAIIWTAAAGMQDLNSTIADPPTDWTPTAATVINRSGLIAGIGYSNITTEPPSGSEHAFVLNGETLIELPELGFSMYPRAMNASGEVAGLFFDSSEHAFIYTPERGTVDIGNLGGPLADASDVNDLGVVVGGSELANGSSAAFIYTDAGGMVNLNTLAPIDGWTLDYAGAINDEGQIAAQGYNGEYYQSFLLTPTPEPPTLLLFTVAACSLLIARLSDGG